MDAETALEPRRPRLNPYTKAQRRERIFTRLKLGGTYEKIAREEVVSDRRIRQIAADAGGPDDPTSAAATAPSAIEEKHSNS
jgi:hypothetical protein